LALNFFSCSELVWGWDKPLSLGEKRNANVAE